MEHNSKKLSIKSLRLKRLIAQQWRIHKKAKSVMSDTPPNINFASSFKARYKKPSRLVSLPPLPLHSAPSRLDTVIKSPIPHLLKLEIPKKTLGIGILQGIPKYFSIRRRSKSQEIKFPKAKVEISSPKSISSESEFEISPMTILVKLKEHNNK